MIARLHPPSLSLSRSPLSLSTLPVESGLVQFSCAGLGRPHGRHQVLTATLWRLALLFFCFTSSSLPLLTHIPSFPPPLFLLFFSSSSSFGSGRCYPGAPNQVGAGARAGNGNGQSKTKETMRRRESGASFPEAATSESCVSADSPAVRCTRAVTCTLFWVLANADFYLFFFISPIWFWSSLSLFPAKQSRRRAIVGRVIINVIIISGPENRRQRRGAAAAGIFFFSFLLFSLSLARAPRAQWN